MRARWMLPRLVCLILLTSSSTVLAQTPVGTILGEDGASQPVAFVAMDNGDIYRSHLGQRVGTDQPQGPWILHCNLFEVGGPISRVAGFCGEVLLTEAGGVYRISLQTPRCAIFDGMVGIPAGHSIVATGSEQSVNGWYVYAVTDHGHVYRGSAPAGWEFAGIIPVGPTAAPGHSWGQVKRDYWPGATAR